MNDLKLNPGERSILAGFPTDTRAEAAQTDLRAAGFTVQVDRVERFGYDPEVDPKRPVFAGQESSLANATLHPASMDDESRVLLAAMPNASGMAGPSTQDGTPFLLTVLTRDERVAEALSIIRKHGGQA